MQSKNQQNVVAVTHAGQKVNGLDTGAGRPKIAVQVHIFFTDLMDEILKCLNLIPYPYDCYISTDTPEKKSEILECFKGRCTAHSLTVRVYPNRGRDVAPFLEQMKEVISHYKYVGHLHTKKSETVDFGDCWRRFLYRNLFGSREYLLALFEMMERDDRLGLIMPPIYPVIENGADWSGTKEAVDKMLRKMGDTVNLPEKPAFPAGDMFWAKVDAVRALFERGYTQEDFPDEAGQVNFTLAHVVERIWVYLAEGQGYTYRICQNVLPHRAGEREKRITLYVHYDSRNQISTVDMQTLKAIRKETKELVVISNSMLPLSEQSRLAGLADQILMRENKGFDFGALKYAMSQIGFAYFQQFDQLVLVNNSSIGPIYDLAAVFDEMRGRKKDFWGISMYPYCEDGSFVDAPYIPEHIQSYFVVFNRPVFQSEAFRTYWNEYELSDDFARTIAQGEIKLTEYLKDAGFSYGAYLPETVNLPEWFHTGQPHNELPYQYAILGSPFLKKKSNVFVSTENRERLIDYLEQLEIPECYVEFFRDIPPRAIPGESGSEKRKNIVARGVRLIKNQGIQGVIQKCANLLGKRREN